MSENEIRKFEIESLGILRSWLNHFFSEIKFTMKKVLWPYTFGLLVLKLEGLLLSYLLWSIEFAMVFDFLPSQAEVMDARRSINFKQLNFCIFLSKLAWVVMGIVWVVNDRHTRNFQLIFVFKSAVAPCVYIIYCLCTSLTTVTNQLKSQFINSKIATSYSFF